MLIVDFVITQNKSSIIPNMIIIKLTTRILEPVFLFDVIVPLGPVLEMHGLPVEEPPV